MKRICFFIITLLVSAAPLYAQSEVKGDSIHSNALPDGTPPEGMLMLEVKNYDGFLLDMSLMKMEAPRLPKFTLEIPEQAKTTVDYSVLIRTLSTHKGFQMYFHLPIPPFTV